MRKRMHVSLKRIRFWKRCYDSIQLMSIFCNAMPIPRECLSFAVCLHDKSKTDVRL